MPEGDALETGRVKALSPKSSLSEFGEPSFIARSAEPYMPDTSFPDDYHFQVGDVFTEDTFVKALGSSRMRRTSCMCFAIRYQAADVAALEQKDADEEGPGYTCFGGPGVGQSFGPVAGWAPGGLPQIT